MTLRRKIASTAASMAVLLLVLLILFGDNGLITLYQLRARHAEMAGINEQLRQENLHMYRAIERLKSDLVFIEHVARHELGMIRPNEIIFKFEHENIRR